MRGQRRGGATRAGAAPAAVLSMYVPEADDTYAWPAAHAKPPRCGPRTISQICVSFYSEDDINGFHDVGGYLGYRVGIRENGTSVFFIAGH